MRKSSEYGTPDAENPRWEKGAIRKAMRLHDLSPEVQRALAPTAVVPGEAVPKKKPVSIRLSPDVLEALRAQGRGWQTKVDETLREKFVKQG